LCVSLFVRKSSLFFITNRRRKKIYREGNGRIFRPVNSFLHETLLLLLFGRNCKHRNLTASYYGCNYILNCNVITQSQEMTLLLFIIHMNMRYISYLVQMLFSPPGTVMLAVLTSYFIDAFFQLMYRFWCMAPRLRLQLRRETR
jgi:hypothetical protein